MTRVILSAFLLSAAVLMLAACGGSGKTSGVAGAQHTTAASQASQVRPWFRTSVDGFEAQLQTSAQAFQSGDLAKAARGRSLLSRCASTVNGQLRPEATGAAEQGAVAHLSVACSDLAKAFHAGASGNLTRAKVFAGAALAQAQIAVRLTG